jgi:hypothetical protein
MRTVSAFSSGSLTAGNAGGVAPSAGRPRVICSAMASASCRLIAPISVTTARLAV